MRNNWWIGRFLLLPRGGRLLLFTIVPLERFCLVVYNVMVAVPVAVAWEYCFLFFSNKCGEYWRQKKEAFFSCWHVDLVCELQLNQTVNVFLCCDDWGSAVLVYTLYLS
jgi:hypothetical protein